ncbi:MAG: alpha/beta hydrolase fold domain-containing protein [Candidatus Omnitrophica bacterium]|nr:alpha/beta hydrolase fold domain-containing protein [Candidatus Omnitrophota bacterium]
MSSNTSGTQKAMMRALRCISVARNMKMMTFYIFRSILFLILLTRVVGASEIKSLKNIRYGRPHQKTLLMDLYLPSGSDPAQLPVVLYIHGGGWESGDKKYSGGWYMPLLGHGFAVASINYRLSGQAPFPAQLYDVKTAVRFLRANAERFGLDPDRIGAFGDSAGAHLAFLLGTTGGLEVFEGDGPWKSASSRVMAVCGLYGPVDLMALEKKHPFSEPGGILESLLGGPVPERQKVAVMASPISHVSPDDPPFLIVHGEKDLLVPYGQSVALYRQLKARGVDVTLHLVEGAGHGKGFGKATRDIIVEFFLDKLKKP